MLHTIMSTHNAAYNALHNAAELSQLLHRKLEMIFTQQHNLERSSLLPSATHNAAHDYERAMNSSADIH